MKWYWTIGGLIIALLAGFAGGYWWRGVSGAASAPGPAPAADSGRVRPGTVPPPDMTNQNSAIPPTPSPGQVATPLSASSTPVITAPSNVVTPLQPNKK